MRVPSMLLSLGLTWAGMFGSAFAQSLDPEPVNPPPFPPRSRPSNLTTNRAVLRPSKPLTNGFTYAAPARASAAAPSASANALQFDSKEKTVNVKSGETEAKFVFAVTNVSKEELTIMSVHTSCGCTAAKLPSTPWVLKPGEGGEVGATMNLAGKFGTVTKTVTVSHGVLVHVVVLRLTHCDEANSSSSLLPVRNTGRSLRERTRMTKGWARCKQHFRKL